MNKEYMFYIYKELLKQRRRFSREFLTKETSRKKS